MLLLRLVEIRPTLLNCESVLIVSLSGIQNTNYVWVALNSLVRALNLVHLTTIIAWFVIRSLLDRRDTKWPAHL